MAAKEGAGNEPMWVKGRNGVAGNEAADKRAEDAVMKGQRMCEPSLARLASIRQAYLI